MIDWMQRHKKWLIVVIWVSTISLIAAGLVGWGAYNFSSSNDIVAKVGKIQITRAQFQRAYQQIYAQYNIDGNLDTQKANDLGLPQRALEDLISRALLQNFALDLGIRVSKKEVEEEIAKMQVFQQIGHFDFALYQSVLEQNHIKPAEFEQEVRDSILSSKIMAVLPLNDGIGLTSLEKDALNFPFEIADQIEFKVISQSSFKLQPNNEEIRQFWEKTKDQYQSPAEYKIEYLLIKNADQKPQESELKNLYEERKSLFINDDGSLKTYQQVKGELVEEQKALLAEEKALREYVIFKKETGKYGKQEVLVEGDKRFGVEIFDTIQQLNSGQTAKPVEVKDGFLVIKMLDKQPRKIKAFEDVKIEVIENLKKELSTQKMIEKSHQLLQEGFNGVKTGFLTALDFAKLPFGENDSKKFLNHLFVTPKKQDYVLLEDKSIVYKILEQKLVDKKQVDPKILVGNEQAFGFYKRQLIAEELYKYLQNKYKITKYYTGN
ncbi:hypothetical protein BBW65_06270 [Helicobacter enhydrae]|uniref:PpiC domain-containing protein n=1 Tax=Helicobacter enhydrae TaxID=222136 RepID=A0A1B1U6K0_9HELI|nr:peptidylprolyl isomerase [Helicobacter enhydrae]ANV98424.1 hypothetical protein BBW65_06270 [Helicobacter enhydrae]